MKVKEPQLGGICQSVQGRDKGRYYIIVRVEKEGVAYVADGNYKRLSEPKRKNVKHLYLLPEKAEAIGEKLSDGRQVFDTEIYSALKSYNTKPSAE